MEIGEIISDSLNYPLNNIMALIIYMVLGIALGLVMAATGISSIFTGSFNLTAGAVLGIIGMILCLLIYFLIQGYMLDVVKYGINARSDAPGIDFMRNVVNGFQLTIVQIVYFIIPLIITILVKVIFSLWITIIVGIILFIIFGLAAFMAECRLANSENLMYSLNISEALGDISRIGIGKLIATLIIIAIIAAIIRLIVGGLLGLIPYVGEILTGILGVYLLFFGSRSMGLLYSDISN